MSRKTHRWDGYNLLITGVEPLDAGEVIDCYISKGIISFVTAQGTFRFTLRDEGRPHRKYEFYDGDRRKATLIPPKRGGTK